MEIKREMDINPDFYVPRHDGIQGELELALRSKPTEVRRGSGPELGALHTREETGLRYALEIGEKRIGYGVFEGREL